MQICRQIMCCNFAYLHMILNSTCTQRLRWTLTFWHFWMLLHTSENAATECSAVGLQVPTAAKMADYKRKYNEWVRFQAEEVTQDYGGTPAVANPSVPCCWFNGLTSRMAGVEQSKSVSGLTYGSGFTRWRFIRQSLLQPCGSTHHQSIVRWYRVDTCWGLNQSVKASLRVYSISPEAWISLSKKKFSSGDFLWSVFWVKLL